jgi:hypothetical protein
LALGALVVGTGALASGAAVPVTLRLIGTASPETGQSIRLTATAKLPPGAHVLVQARVGSRPAARVIECLRSPCSATYRRLVEGDVSFQALVIKRAGRKVTTLGRSSTVSVSWTEPLPPLAPPPPPPPPSAATPGHFAGTIGNAQSPIAFDIGPDALSLRNLVTGEIDESCDPATYTFWFTGIHGPGPYPVAADGSFNHTSSGGDPSSTTYVIKFSGRVTGGTASGILHVESSYLMTDGNRLNCSSGDQPWTATKTG